MTVPEAATALRISRSHFYQLVSKGHVELVHINRSARVRRSALEAYVASLSAHVDEKSEPDAA
jgi:excisionase family DNA binding protein